MDIEKVKAEVREMFPGADSSCSWMIFIQGIGTIGVEQAHTEEDAWKLAHEYCQDCKQAKFDVIEKQAKAKCILVDDEYLIIINKKKVLGCGYTEPDAWRDAAENMRDEQNGYGLKKDSQDFIAF